MRRRDRVDDREPDPEAGALPFLRARRALEDRLRRVQGHARARVGDLDHEALALLTRLELDRVARLRVLDRVLEQGIDRDPKRIRVGVGIVCGGRTA